MSAVSGTRRAIKELVDGTIRVQVDIDPQFRKQFFDLFADIDMRVALAPLRSEAEVIAADRPKGGELAKLAGMLCDDERFQAWIAGLADPDDLAVKVNRDGSCDGLTAAEQAAHLVRHICGVKSRAELDHNHEAAVKFHEKVRKPWHAECAK